VCSLGAGLQLWLDICLQGARWFFLWGWVLWQAVQGWDARRQFPPSAGEHSHCPQLPHVFMGHECIPACAHPSSALACRCLLASSSCMVERSWSGT
jgi:hypothetical protein